MDYRRFILVLSILIPVFALQIPAQHSPGLEWYSRKTERFELIYPEEMSHTALTLAAVLDDVLDDAEHDLNVPRPILWPLILSNQGLESNGYVSMAPLKSVFYTIPGEDFTAPSDWLMLLARHEGRHMAAFGASDVGVTRGLHLLLGEYGWAGGLFGSTPSWLLEGDAVLHETLYSNEGRGRDSLFTDDALSYVVEMLDGSYHTATNPSYRRHIPDIYHFGYQFASYLRSVYGETAVAEIYQSSARFGLPIIGLRRGFRTATGQTPNELYDQMTRDLRVWARDMETDFQETPAIIVSPSIRRSAVRVWYDALYPLGSGDLVVRRRTLDQRSQLVRISQGQESPIAWVPSSGRIGYGGGKAVWTAIRHHPIYDGSSVGDINILDLETGRRRTILTGTRLLYPDLDESGQRLVAVDMLTEGGSRLVVYEQIESDWIRIDESPSLENLTAAYPSWDSRGNQIVFTVQGAGGRQIAEWSVGTPEIVFRSSLSYATLKHAIYAGETILYSGNESGLEAIWSLSPGGNRDMVATRWYSASAPAWDAQEESLYFIEYDSIQGDRILRIEGLSVQPGDGESEYVRNLPFDIESPVDARFTDSLADLDSTDLKLTDELYPETPYRIAGSAFNPHSWGFSLNQALNGRLGLSVVTQDVLSTVTTETGVTYLPFETSAGAFNSVTFTAMNPILGVSTEYLYREIASNPRHQASMSIGATLPMNLDRSGYWSHQITFGIKAGLQWVLANQDPVSSGIWSPVLHYTSNWYRLLRGSHRALKPQFGWDLSLGYSHIPLPLRYEDALWGNMDTYWPGGLRNTSLSLGVSGEWRRGDFVGRIALPRGYRWNDHGFLAVGRFDWAFPIWYPDLAIGSVAFFQRFRGKVFTDVAWETSQSEHHWEDGLLKVSTGMEISLDFSAFDQFPGLSVGLRFSWLWETGSPRFELLIMDTAVL